jgi:IS605 OrfB family transposase
MSNAVKLVAMVKLIVDAWQRDLVLATMARVNAACSWLAERAFELGISDKFRLQKLYYRTIRERFGLAAQHVVRLISKVCQAYKRDPSTLPRFRTHGAIQYDQRLYTFKSGLDLVSILTLDGRITVPCAIGSHHRDRLDGARGQADLVCRNGTFFLFVTVDVPDGIPIEPKGWIGVDLGIRNLAVDSDGATHSGAQTLAVRSRIAKLRAGLQSAGTTSAKRHIRKLRGREQRFHSHTNHVISKHIVRKAKDTARGIAIEDLGGIRERVTVRKAQRSALHSWSFAQLRDFITYKAALSGVQLVVVDPRNTSRTCPECGCVDKASRRSQASFSCTGCGFAANADHVGARNIASRGSVICPIGSAVRLGIEHSSSPQPCQTQGPGC